MNKLHVALSAIGLVLALGGAACMGGPMGEDELETSTPELRTGYTTRTVCGDCGCVANDVSCNCGQPPRDYKLCCIDQGGDRTGCGYPTKAASSAASSSSSSSGEFSQ